MTDTTEATDAFDVAVLQNLLSSPELCLTTKRALACINHLGEELTNEYMNQPRLYVDSKDCTAINARWILRQLMPRVQTKLKCDLLVCARGEMLAPEMNLKTLMQCGGVRVKGLVAGKECTMTPTAAYFLGHAMCENSEADPYVRLTTGKKKRIQALRVNTRLLLTDEETHQPVDQHIMSGALLANAEQRLEILDRGVAALSFAMLQLDDVTAADLGVLLRRAIVSGNKEGIPYALDLSRNRFGANGLRDFLSPAYGPNGVIAHGHFMDKLDLTGVSLGCRGVKHLAKVLAVGRLNVKELVLAHVDLKKDGVTALVNAYAELSKNELPKKAGRGRLTSLDLSSNPLAPGALAPLLEVDAFPHLQTLKLNNLKVNAPFWHLLVRAIAKENRFPSIDRVDTKDNNGTPDSAVDKALSVARTRREFKAAENTYDEWEAWEAARRAHDAKALAALKVKRAALRELRAAQRAERRMVRAPSPPPLTDPKDAEDVEDAEDEYPAPADHDSNWSNLEGPSAAPNSNTMLF